MSRRIKLLYSALFLTSTISFLMTFLFVSSTNSLPIINGVILKSTQPLKPFSLVDHNNNSFTNSELLGRWHIVSYGYTSCPDICPTTLSILAKVAHKIEQEGTYSDIEFLFYTVDYERDTVDRLSKYMPYFHPKFIGLTRMDNEGGSFQAFEQSLGVTSVITMDKQENTDSAISRKVKNYSVAHGVMLYLLNPAGELQAILKPSREKDGAKYFSAEKIYNDYRSIRDFMG